MIAAQCPLHEQIAKRHKRVMPMRRLPHFRSALHVIFVRRLGLTPTGPIKAKGKLSEVHKPALTRSSLRNTEYPFGGESASSGDTCPSTNK